MLSLGDWDFGSVGGENSAAGSEWLETVRLFPERETICTAAPAQLLDRSSLSHQIWSPEPSDLFVPNHQISPRPARPPSPSSTSRTREKGKEGERRPQTHRLPRLLVFPHCRSPPMFLAGCNSIGGGGELHGCNPRCAPALATPVATTATRWRVLWLQLPMRRRCLGRRRSLRGIAKNDRTSECLFELM